MMLIQQSVNSDWLFSTQSRVLQAERFILEIKERATLNINMPYWCWKLSDCCPSKTHAVMFSGYDYSKW